MAQMTTDTTSHKQGKVIKKTEQGSAFLILQ
ncbi:MAG: hypothetical protein ACJAYG_001254 [Oceanicoccus sp.]|jgi:hypothetical protein